MVVMILITLKGSVQKFDLYGAGAGAAAGISSFNMRLVILIMLRPHLKKYIG